MRPFTHAARRSTLIPSLATLLAAALLLSACPGPDVKPDKPPVDEPPAAKMEEVDPTLPPVPEETVKASGIEEFEVEGIHVILKKTDANPVVSVDLFIDGGLSNVGEDNVGVERLALVGATRGGTESTPRDEFNAKLDSMGSSVGSSAGRDFSTVSMNCVSPFFAPTWELFAQALTEPAFDEKQLEISRQQTIESIKAIEEDPDEYVGLMATELHYEGHPYEFRTMGTEANVKAFTKDQLADFYRELIAKDRLHLVVVGDVSRATLEKYIKDDLADLPENGLPLKPLPELKVKAPGIKYATKELPTNYLFGFFAAPDPTHPDYYALKVATSILRDRLFEEIRTKRNLTYAVSAGLSSRRENIGYLYVTTTKPQETIKVMYDEVEKLASKPLEQKTLDNTIEVFLTRHYMGLETNGAQAGSLGSYELLSDGWERSLVYIDLVKRVTPEDVNRVIETYLKDVHWGYVGDEKAADEALMKSR